MTVVAVQPAAIVVVLNVEHVRVAIGVGYVRGAAQDTAPRLLLGLYSLRDGKSPSTAHQDSSFFKKHADVTLFPTVVKNILGASTAGFGSPAEAGRIRLVPFLSIRKPCTFEHTGSLSFS